MIDLRRGSGVVYVPPPLLSLSRTAFFAELRILESRPLIHFLYWDLWCNQWTDQAFFLSSPLSPGLSELPAGGGQWKVLRFGEHVRRRGGGEWVWEWEQGWEQGVTGAKEGWRR